MSLEKSAPWDAGKKLGCSGEGPQTIQSLGYASIKRGGTRMEERRDKNAPAWA
jgi:hypothetical protein